MNATGRTLAITLILGAAGLAGGCNTPGFSNPDRLDSEAAARRHGSLEAARAVWVFENGSLAITPDEGEIRRANRGFNSAGLSAVWVPEHPSTPDREIQVGWIEFQQNGAGVTRRALMDRDWRTLAYLQSDGTMIDSSGFHSWGDSRFSVLQAATAIFGKGEYVAVPNSRYELTTSLPFRSGGRFEDEPFSQRGVSVVRQPEMVSVRPLGPGELQRLAQSLSRGTFEQQQQARMAALQSEREEASKSPIPEKPADAFRPR